MNVSNNTGLQGDHVTPSTNNVSTTYFYYTAKEADIVLGLIYLFFGLFGICSNGSVLWQFWSVRRTVKVMPFTLCAIVLAANDCVLCLLGVTPYAALILAGRPPKFSPFLCKIFGFVNNFCDRFAWFDITGIMVFRCISMLFPMKLRNMRYAPFIYILSLMALLQGIISALPFFNLKMVVDRYVYVPNFGECAYFLDSNLAPAMIIVVDVLWWGPFLACAVSSVVFIVAMRIHAAKFSGVGKGGSGMDAKKKTLILTAFFLACYLPKAIFTTYDFLLSNSYLISWESSYNAIGKDNFIITYLYLYICCKFIIPAARAAFTPTMLRLNKYIRMCDTSKRNTRHRSTVSVLTDGLSTLREKLTKSDSFKKLKGIDEHETGNNAKAANEQSQLV